MTYRGWLLVCRTFEYDCMYMSTYLSFFVFKSDINCASLLTWLTILWCMDMWSELDYLTGICYMYSIYNMDRCGGRSYTGRKTTICVRHFCGAVVRFSRSRLVPRGWSSSCTSIGTLLLMVVAANIGNRRDWEPGVVMEESLSSGLSRCTGRLGFSAALGVAVSLAAFCA